MLSHWLMRAWELVTYYTSLIWFSDIENGNWELSTILARFLTKLRGAYRKKVNCSRRRVLVAGRAFSIVGPYLTMSGDVRCQILAKSAHFKSIYQNFSAVATWIFLSTCMFNSEQNHVLFLYLDRTFATCIVLEENNVTLTGNPPRASWVNGPD